MSHVAFLGTGMLGSGMAHAAIARGESVVVWNRSPGKTSGLAGAGARVAASPEDAVRGASRVHLVLSDDASVDAVLAAAKPGFSPGALVLDHTTTAPDLTALRIAKYARERVAILHTPVFMSPAMARDGKGYMLASGPKWLFEKARPHMEKMTEQVLYLGERVDLAAGYKLFGNAMIFAIIGGVTDVFALARAMNVELADALTLFEKFNPARNVDVRGKKLASGDFSASFEATMARKDARLMIELAARGGFPLINVTAFAHALDEAIAKGRGQDDMGVVAATIVESKKGAHAAPVMEQLTRCHRKTEEIVDRATRGEVGAGELASFLASNVARHETDEESSLFPKLAGLGLDATTSKIREEHVANAALTKRVEELAARANKGENVAADLTALGHELRHVYHAHIALEEGVLFPGAVHALAEADWSIVKDEMAARRAEGASTGARKN